MTGQTVANDRIASTLGWDTAFGIHVSSINADIAARQSYPAQFDVTDEKDPFSASGSFGPWAIALGGDQDLVYMRLPIPKVTITSPGGKTETLTDVSASIAVRLTFRPSDKAAATGVLHELVIWNGAPAGTDIVTVDRISYNGPDKPSFLTKAVFRELLAAWLSANIGSFDHIFTTVNINRTADVEDFQWLQPTETAYAYCDLDDSNDGILGVMCMTEGRPSTGLVQQLSSSIIPHGKKAGYLIGAHRVIDKVLLPKMTEIFKGSKLEDFKISDSGKSIINAHKNIKFTVKDPNSDDTCEAYIETLEVVVIGEELQLNVVTRVDVSPGVRAWCHTNNALGLQLVQKKSGKPGEQTMNFRTIRETVDHWLEKDPVIGNTERIVMAVGAILVGIAAFLTGGAILLIVGVILLLGSALMMITMGTIDLVAKDDAPEIDSFVLNGTASVKWDDAKDFKLESACLNESMQFGGTLHPKMA